MNILRRKAFDSDRSGSRGASRGFSLVELLVVIGIIAVLIAILLPVLARVREQATMMKCLANLRTCGQAFVMFADEHKGHLPYPQTTLGEQALWFTAVDPYLNSIANANRGSGVTSLRAYSEFKQCPLVNNLFNLANGSSDSGTSSTVNYQAGEDTCSYKMNSCLRHYNPNIPAPHYTQAKITQVPNSSNFVLMGDGISLDITGAFFNASSGQTQSTAFDMDPDAPSLGVASCPMVGGGPGVNASYVRHRGACNILFVDGHAESLTLPLEPEITTAQKAATQLTGSASTVFATTWQSEYLQSSGTEYRFSAGTLTSLPAGTTRNPNMPLQWSEIGVLNR